MKKKNLSKIELLEQKIQREEQKRNKFHKQETKKFDKLAEKLNDLCYNSTVGFLYVFLALPMLMPVFAFAAFNMIAPAIAAAVVGYGWLPSLIGAAGIFKLCSKIQQKRLSKKLYKIDDKIIKLKKERMSTDILSHYEILDSNVETLFLSTEDGFRIVKEKYREAKKETKEKIKDAKKKAGILKKYEVLRQTQIKLSDELNVFKVDNINKKSLMIKSDKKIKEREI